MRSISRSRSRRRIKEEEEEDTKAKEEGFWQDTENMNQTTNLII